MFLDVPVIPTVMHCVMLLLSWHEPNHRPSMLEKLKQQCNMGSLFMQQIPGAHVCLVLNVAAMLLQAVSERLPQQAHPPFGVVDAAIVPITEDHASIDHGRHVGRHRAPAVALNVNEAQQLRITYVPTSHIARIGGQEAGKRQAGDRMLGKLCWHAQSGLSNALSDLPMQECYRTGKKLGTLLQELASAGIMMAYAHNSAGMRCFVSSMHMWPAEACVSKSA